MQRLVTRAGAMKEKDRDNEPMADEIRPWMKVQNKDMF